MKFTIDTFENSLPHFLDIEICPNELGIYHKHTQTIQYVHIISYKLWKWETSWICPLVIRAKRICSANYFNNEIQLIKRYVAWNGCPWNVVKGIIKHALRNNDNNNTFDDNDKDAVRIYIKIKYSRETADVWKSFTSVLRMKKELNLFYNMKQLNHFISPTQKIKFRCLANRQ